METVLYADVLFFVNFSMDFISLWASMKLTGAVSSVWRMCLSACLGAVYGVFAVYEGLYGIYAYASAIFVSMLMAIVAFGLSELFRRTVLIWGSGALLSGTLTVFLGLFGKVSGEYSSFAGGFVISVSVLSVYFTVRILVRARRKKPLKVTLIKNGRKITLDVLGDSGNLLEEPLTGTPVMPISSGYAEMLIGRELTYAVVNMDTEVIIKEKLKISVIPAKSLGGRGVYGAFFPDAAYIEGKKRQKIHILLLPVDCPKNYFGGYGATINI